MSMFMALAGGGFTFSGPTDPYYQNVVLLSSFDGPNGAVSAVDDGPLGLALSCVGACALSSANPVFGATSLAVNPANEGTGYMTVSGPANFNFGLSDFTIEGWAESLFNHSGWWHSILGNFTGNSPGSWSVFVTNNPANKLVFAVTGGVSVQGSLDFNNDRHHFAVCRNGANLRLFVDGAMIAKSTGFASIHVGNSGAGFVLGGNGVGASDRWRGLLDEIRITSGVGRYNFDTSFAVPVAPYPKS